MRIRQEFFFFFFGGGGAVRHRSVLCLRTCALRAVVLFYFILSKISFQSLASTIAIWSKMYTPSVQPGAVKLVLWRHWMHLTQVRPVTSENQFHCTRLYSVHQCRHPLWFLWIVIRRPITTATCNHGMLMASINPFPNLSRVRGVAWCSPHIWLPLYRFEYCKSRIFRTNQIFVHWGSPTFCTHEIFVQPPRYCNTVISCTTAEAFTTLWCAFEFYSKGQLISNVLSLLNP